MTRRYSIVLGLAAIFREAAPYSGVGENLPTTGQGIVVPSRGSTLVILEDDGASTYGPPALKGLCLRVRRLPICLQLYPTTCD